MPTGVLNWPGADPNVPHSASDMPVGENFWMRLLPAGDCDPTSVTYRLPCASRASLSGLSSWPGPEPCSPHCASSFPEVEYLLIRSSSNSARYMLPWPSNTMPEIPLTFVEVATVRITCQLLLLEAALVAGEPPHPAMLTSKSVPPSQSIRRLIIVLVSIEPVSSRQREDTRCDRRSDHYGCMEPVQLARPAPIAAEAVAWWEERRSVVGALPCRGAPSLIECHQRHRTLENAADYRCICVVDLGAHQDLERRLRN